MNGTRATFDRTLQSQQSNLLFFLSNAPFSMLSTALPGVLNFGIIIFLTYGPGFEDAGAYRFLLAIHGLIGLAAMAETHKIYIRSIVNEEQNAVPALWVNRLLFAILPFALMLIYSSFSLIFGTSPPPISFLWIAAISALIYTTDYYIGHLQARTKFGLLFGVELTKYSVALSAFLFVFYRGYPVELAVIALLATSAFLNFLYSLIFTRNLFSYIRFRPSISKLFSSGPAQQARTYSFANMLPASLEHIDKLLVGWVFGLEWLGIYTLAFSTGRLIYNSIKPAFYIYYQRFVTAMPTRALLWKLGISGTLAGGSLITLFLLMINYWPIMERFRLGAIVTVIIFSGYGIGIVRSVYAQAFALNRNSIPTHAWRASLWACLLTMPLLFIACLLEPTVALTLLALQYPVRDLATIHLLAKYRRLAE